MSKNDKHADSKRLTENSCDKIHKPYG